MCERERKCDDDEEEETGSDDDEAQFDVDHFDPVNRNNNGIQKGTSDGGGGTETSGRICSIVLSCFPVLTG